MATTGVTIRRIERARTAARRSDYLLVLVTLALLAIGLMMVYSTTFDWAYQATGNPLTFFLRQMVWAALGLVGMAVLSRVDYGWWRRLAVPVLVLAIGALVLVLLVGDETFGARRTLLRGSLQPSEPAKLAIVIYVAAWLSSKGEKLRRITYGLIPFSVLIGVVVGLIVLEPDFSTAILIALVAGAMFFVAGADLLQILIGGLVGGGTFYLLITHSAHASQRLADYVAAWQRPEQASHHVRQALIALGSGGIFGRGLGAGYQKFGYLPAPHTDSIFAVVGEELGLVGCLLVIGLFALLAQRGFKIALEARDGFGALLASGITFWLVFQTLINIAVMTAVVPFTGIPLPFLSAGGSSLVSCLAAVGVLLSVSRGSRLEVEGRASALLRGWDRRTRLSRPGRR
ncbi:MAG TPA: putative lipid II flippase FtsW [Chloroflexi bacterium]|nr:putative lipid II flippase FtsW [Chloroflexota bacterium]